MRRWHSERDLMLRRWRREIAQHGGHPGWRCGWHTWRHIGEGQSRRYWWGNGWLEAAIPPADVCEDDCHCFRGPGYFRKRRPFESYRWREDLSRQAERREAIRYSLDGYDGLVL